MDKQLRGTIRCVTDYGQAWTIDALSASRDYNNLDANVERTEGNDADSDSESDTGSESDSESKRTSESDDGVENVLGASTLGGKLVPEAYTEFLRFLELGCSGSPVEGYPLILIVLAGMPKSVWFVLRIPSSA